MFFEFKNHCKYILILFLIILNACQLQEPTKNHGILFLENRANKIKINQNNKNLGIFWYKNGIPEVIKIYNTNYFYGKNWVGVLEKKIVKQGSSSKKSFFEWYFLLFALFIAFFISWYRESKS